MLKTVRCWHKEICQIDIIMHAYDLEGITILCVDYAFIFLILSNSSVVRVLLICNMLHNEIFCLFAP